MPKEEDKPEPVAPASGGGGKKTVILLAATALLSLAIGGGVAYVVVGRQAAEVADEDAPADDGGEAGADHGDEKPRKKPAKKGAQPEEEEGEGGFAARVLSLDPFVVNLRGTEYARYVKVKIELETEAAEAKAGLEGRKAQIRDAIILLLSSKDLEEISEFEGKALLKEEILQRVNDLAEAEIVRSVLFTEFVIQ